MEPDAFRGGPCHRLFEQDVSAGLEALFGKLEVGADRRCDGHGLHTGIGQGFREIRRCPRARVAGGQAAQAVGVAVHNP